MEDQVSRLVAKLQGSWQTVLKHCVLTVANSEMRRWQTAPGCYSWNPRYRYVRWKMIRPSVTDSKRQVKLLLQ
jgi:hypothetical protein